MDKDQKMVPQSGYIPEEPSSEDYLAGTLPHEIRLESGKWEEYLPDGERQSNPFVFDTMSCVTFACLNSLETQLRLLTLPEEHKKFLFDNGYYKDGKINFSDKFTAIISKTTQRGNTYRNVADAIKSFGLIPETLLPFKNEQSWEEYHNPAQITLDHKTLGWDFLEFFDIGFEVTLSNTNDKEIDRDERDDIEFHLKHAPLIISIPNPGTHAVMLPSFYNIFDTYEPFYKPGKKNIHFVYKLVITPKTPLLTMTLRIGNKGAEVRKLQRKLGIYADGVFGPKTDRAVRNFQMKYGMTPDGIVGQRTRTALNQIPIEPAPTQTLLARWIEAIKKMEGAKPHRNNPGNLRYAGQRHAIDDFGFCKFDTYEHGYQALEALLIRAATGKSKYYKPEMTLLEFYGVYAPASDGNHPESYAKFVAGRLGIPVTTQIKTLV